MLWLPMRVFLAAGWVRAVAEKVPDPDWWSGAVIRAFVEDQRDAALPLAGPIVDHGIVPAVAVVAVLVVLVEVATAVGFLTRRWFVPALRLGSSLNVAFVVMGRIDPSAFYLVMQLTLLLALSEGAVDGRVRRPTRRTMIASVALGAGGLAMLPFIQTLRPAEVVHDPAIMLAFLAALASGMGLLRWALHERPGLAASVSTTLRARVRRRSWGSGSRRLWGSGSRRPSINRRMRPNPDALLHIRIRKRQKPSNTPVDGSMPLGAHGSRSTLRTGS